MTCSFVPPLPLSLANVVTDVPASTAPAWLLANTYALGDVVIDSVSRIEYESLQAANTGHALSDAAWWLSRGVENRLRMFDQSVGSQTTAADAITLTITPGRVVNTLALLNADAQSVRVVMTDPVDGVKFDRTTRLIVPSGKSWWRWYFTDVQRDTRLLITDLPSYSQATITVTITNTGGTAACGVLLLGRATVLGNAKYGSSIGFDDYSVKSRDAFGGWDIRERAYSDHAKFQVLVEGAMVDRIRDTLVPYRAKACLYIGAELLRSTWTYGYFTSFENVFSLYGVSDCNLEVEGTT